MTRQQFGTLLLIAGVCAWGAYYGLKLLTPLDPPLAPFLIWHLSGVIPGALLRGSKVIRWLVRKIGSQPEADAASAD